MATEKRLIDANAFKEFLENVRQDYIEENTFSSDFAACVIETVQDNYLDLAPTVDAVEVVRCKDCKHYMLWEDSVEHKTCAKAIGLMASDPEDFCSYGERKDNG